MDKFFQKHIYLKIFCVLSIDLFIILISLPLAYLIRTEDIYLYVRNFDSKIHLILCLSYLVLFFFNNLQLESIRYFNRLSIINYLKIYLILSVVFILYDFFIKKDYVVLRSIPIIFLFISFTLSVSYRIVIGRILNLSNRKILKKERIIIYGASEQDIALSRFLEETKNLITINFIDDKKSKRRINGIKIISFLQFEKNFNKSDYKIYIFDEKNSKSFREKINKLNKYIGRVRVLSSNKGDDEKDFRKLELNDFFVRDEITVLSQDTVSEIQNKIVAITGAGGSIGGNLAEKVFFLNPKILILIDFHEHSLVKIENRLNEISLKNNIKIDIKIFLLNLSDTKSLNNLFKKYNVDFLYHCAAYKHVDVSEKDLNFEIFIKNNFINTKNLILLALRNKIKNFILVSTDKAVNPSNLMGFSKRLCEIYLLELINRLNIENYKIVRFGNVFRSSGSVIPYFEKQIMNGNEINVTHKEVKRYFMSIDEAGLLILESSLIKNKNLLILEMGEQIKIIEIAKLLIRLNPNKNIKINISGLKKGEKLEEELSYTTLNKTEHPSIYSSNENFSDQLFHKIKNFTKTFTKLNFEERKKILKDLVNDY